MSFEKRLALQCLLSNEAQFQAIGEMPGDPQEHNRTKEQAIDDMIALSQAPILALTPPTLPECTTSVDVREEKNLMRLISLLGQY
mmetsp:Transcript_30977/g.47394  ORF Transcript_30977/g.47394 Transcript_30977/m.47394 type:complete len:85 (-) Transcript_30977:368-622(-)